MPTQQLAVPPAAHLAARAALVIGMGYALVSVYWGAGGTWLLDTVGGTLEIQGRAGGAVTAAALCAAAAAKAAAAVIPVLYCRLAAHRPPAKPRRLRHLRLLMWLEAAILSLYGGLLTAAGLLVQGGVIARAAHADERALAWHAYLWDPWFLLWGLLVLVVLARTRPVVGGVT